MTDTITKSLLSFALAVAASQGASTGGKFYGLLWDGSQEHFVSVDPATGGHSSLAVIPDVKFVDASFRVFDPDSSRFVFVGGPSTGAMSYHVLDAATGSVISTAPRSDNLKNPVYDPGTGLVYGTWWSDSTVREYDSLGRPKPVLPHQIQGTEYFAAVNPNTGARTDTPVPDVKTIAASSQFFDTDSGRYVFSGSEGGSTQYYYVIDVATGALLARIPVDLKLDFPVYNAALGAVHGLWWSDSTVREYDSLGRPKPVMPQQIKGAEFFVTILHDSTVTMVELPGVKYISNFNRALDLDNGHYVFTGKETSGPARYYVIDIATGAIVSNAEAQGNVKHLVYAPLSSTSYPVEATALRPARETAAWALRTAPFSGTAVLEFTNPDGAPLAFALSDAAGRVVLRESGITGTTLRIDMRALKPGVHFFRLSGPGKVVAAGKVVVE